MKLSDYHKDDYVGMLINPLKINDIDDLKKSPLSQFKEFDWSMDKIVSVITYISLVYDRKSPLYKMDDLDKRKASAALMAGFSYDGQFSENIVRMIRCRVPKINLMILRYCRMCNGRKYALFAAGNESFHGTLSEIMNYTPSDDGDVLKDNKTKLELFEKAKDNAELLDELGHEILGMDKTREINEGLSLMVEIVGVSDLPLSVEDFVRLWELQGKQNTTEEK